MLNGPNLFAGQSKSTQKIRQTALQKYKRALSLSSTFYYSWNIQFKQRIKRKYSQSLWTLDSLNKLFNFVHFWRKQKFRKLTTGVQGEGTGSKGNLLESKPKFSKFSASLEFYLFISVYTAPWAYISVQYSILQYVNVTEW